MKTVLVRASITRTTLWFHLDFAITRSTDPLELSSLWDSRHVLGLSFGEGYTDQGRELLKEIFLKSGIMFRTIQAHERYFSIDVPEYKHWQQVLQALIDSLGKVTGTEIRFEPFKPPQECWHLPLLEQFSAQQ